MIAIREERAGDEAGVRRVNLEAFGQPGEAGLVDALRTAEAVTLSLVAEDAGSVVGHILFTPVGIESDVGRSPGVALGPMAVLPERQREGIGSRLVTRGLELLQEQGHDLVILVGHPEYYPRFGFVPASRLALRCTWDVPDEVFMARELRPGAGAGVAGVVHYRPEFEGL